MQFQLSIPEDLQYGRLPAADARPGRLQRSMQQVLIKALASQLDDGDAGDVQSSDDPNKLPPRFEQALARFSGEIASVGWKRKSRYGDLWHRLLEAQRELEAAEAEATEHSNAGPAPTADDTADPLIEDDTTTLNTPDPVETRTVKALFCLTLYGLCGAFAAQHLERGAKESVQDAQEGQAQGPPPDDSEGLEETGAGDDAEELTPVEFDAALSVTRPFAEITLCELVDRSFPTLFDDDNPDLARAERRLLSGMLLRCCLEAMSDWVKTVKSQGVYHVIVTDAGIAARFERVSIELPFSLPPQPLRKPVAYPLTPGGGETAREGDFRVDLISYRRQNRFLRRLHATLAEHASPGFERYVQAVNTQMAVGWRLNMAVLEAVQNLMERARTGNRMDPTARWVRENLYLPSPTTPRRTYHRPAEFLDHPMMQAVIDELAVRNEDGGQPVFYLPWFADHRGRIYARTPWLTPQGGDVQRALLEFAEGRPLDEAGWAALRRHGANLVSKGRLLGDLGITGRTSVTLEERERWVEEHEREIRASAADPIKEYFWREVAGGSEIQFLAFCLAYRQARDDPQAPIHLPVQIDGTCNGLQHIAALTGDDSLARSVNVLADDSGLPRDIYSELAATTREQIRRRDSAIAPGKSFQKGLQRNIEEWLAGSDLREVLVDRATAKKVIMTIPYGAGEIAQITHVLEHLLPQLQEVPQLQGVSSGSLEDTAVEGLGLPAALRAQAKRPALQDELWHELRRVFRRWLRDQRNRTYDRELDDHVRRDVLEQLRHWHKMKDPRDLALFRIALPLAMVIVKHLQKALEAEYQGPKIFSGFLKKTADQLKGMPLLWLTPLDFPVCQNKFGMKGAHLSAHVLRPKKGAEAQGAEQEEVRIDAKYLSEALNGDAVSEQRRALMPNVIHSFDATHLASTVLTAADRQVRQLGSIHDCFLVHPNDADTLASVVRDTFTRLHRANETGAHAAFADWCNWMELLRRLRSSQNPNILRNASKTSEHRMDALLHEDDQALLRDLRELRANKMCQSMIDHILGFLAQPGDPLPQADEGAISLQFHTAIFGRNDTADQVSRYLFS